MRGPALDLKERILARMAARPGEVWTPVDFLDLAPRASIDKALQRLVPAGQLRRIDRGLYDQPRFNSLTGTQTVSDHGKVIDAVARRDQARVLIDGLTAANDLGLTTAVPARIIVLTDARLRPIKLDSLLISFKTVAPSRLYWAGRPAMRVVQALHWLQDLLPGDRDRILARVGRHLAIDPEGPRIREDLRDGLPTLPTWMQPFVRDLLSASDDGRGGDKPSTVAAPAEGGPEKSRQEIKSTNRTPRRKSTA